MNCSQSVGLTDIEISTQPHFFEFDARVSVNCRNLSARTKNRVWSRRIRQLAYGVKNGVELILRIHSNREPGPKNQLLRFQNRVTIQIVIWNRIYG